MSLRDVLTEGIDHWLTISVVPYFSLDVLLDKEPIFDLLCFLLDNCE